MICPKHGMTMLTYCDECRIEELEAERDDCARVNRDMCAENVRLKAKLHAVERLTRYNCVRGLAGGRAVEPDPTGQFILVEDVLKAIQEQQEACRIEGLEARMILAMQLSYSNYPGYVTTALRGGAIPEDVLNFTARICLADGYEPALQEQEDGN